MIRVMGHGGNVLASNLHKFSSETDQNNWSAWDVSGHLQAEVDAEMIETQVKYADLGTNGGKVAVLVHTRSYDGHSDFSEHIISDEKGVLVVEQFWSDDAKVLAGAGNTILTIEARALGSRMRLTSLTAYLTGDAEPTEIDRIRLIADGGEVDAINSPQSSRLTFTFGTLVVDEDATFIMSLDATITSNTGNTLGAKVSFSSDFELSSGVASLSDAFPRGSMDYIGNVDTDNVEIDGGFSDWNGVETDLDNDTIENPNIDIGGFASKMVPRPFPSIRVDAFFYVNVAGRIAGGSLVPYASPGPLIQLTPARDSDRDTVPDALDTYPFDFNNDGIPDADTNGDVDGDTILDYPLGSDYYLETTIPTGFPPQYEGKEVRIFAGPMITPEVTGEDYLRAYVDIDGDVGGYAVGPVYADYLLEIRGKNGEINSISFLEFDGATLTDWEWISTGKEVAASLDRQRIEAFADVTLLGGDRFEILFEATDWEEMQDRATNISGGGRSATRGSFGEYDARFTSQGYDAYLSDLADKVSFARKGTALSWELPREIRWVDGNSADVLGELIPSHLILDQDAAHYNDAYSNQLVSIEYSFEENMLKEEIILERAYKNMRSGGHLSMVSSLDYSDELMIYGDGEVSGDWATITGDMAFKERDRTRFYIDAPYAVDSSGDRLDCQYLYNSKDKLIDLRCPSDWFLDAEYPVIIDPTVSTYTLENDGTLGQAEEKFGHSVAVGDFNNDGYADVLTGAPYATVSSVTDAGAAYIYYGPFSASDTAPDVYIEGSAGSNLGWAVAAGLFNNDDYWDAAVSQKDDDAYVYYGSSSWSGQENTPDVTFDESSITTDNGLEGFGMSMAAGNFDYDGTPLNFDDLLIGAPFKNLGTGQPGGNYDGVVYCFISVFGSTEVGEDNMLTPDSTKDKGQFGFSIALGKIDSDAKFDVVVGEPWNDTGDGSVQIFYGEEINAVSETPNEWLEPITTDEQFGFSVGVGDMDTNSYADIIVGAPYSDVGGTDIGRAYIYQSETDGSGMLAQSSPSIDLEGVEAGSLFGFNVTVGDFYGDGQGDAIVTAPYNTTNDYGSILIFDDPIGGNDVADDYIDGAQTNEYLGWSIAGGEFANDTTYVLAAGAPDWDDAGPSETDAGRVMVMVIPEYLDAMIIIPLLLVAPILFRRRKRKSL
jgi:hypothetical protein